MKKEPTSTPAKHVKLNYRNGARQLPERSVTVVRSVAVRKSRSGLTLAASSCSNTLWPGCSASSRRMSCRPARLPVRGATRRRGVGISPRSLSLPAKYTTPLSWTVFTLARWFVSSLGLPNTSSPGIGPGMNPPIRGVSCWPPYRHQHLWCVTAKRVSSWPLSGVGRRQAFSAVCFTSGSMSGAS